MRGSRHLITKLWLCNNQPPRFLQILLRVVAHVYNREEGFVRQLLLSARQELSMALSSPLPADNLKVLVTELLAEVGGTKLAIHSYDRCCSF